MIKIHHLGLSQSERILWLCEELSLPYAVQHHQRDSVTRMSPPALKALHPLGAAPLLEDGDLLLAESAAIVDYLLGTHGNGRLRPAPGHPDFAPYLYWFHFANGTLQPAFMRLMQTTRAELAEDHPVRSGARGRVELALSHLDDRLASVPFLAGPSFTAADLMNMFSLTTMRRFQPFDLAAWPHVQAYLQRLGARPAYQRAMAKGDPGVAPLLA